MEFEEGKYGMLMMVLCDREGRVYDVWICFGSVHEVRAFRERKKRSVWVRELGEGDDQQVVNKVYNYIKSKYLKTSEGG